MPSTTGRSWVARTRLSPAGRVVFLVTTVSVLLGVGLWVASRPPVYASSAVVAIVPKGARPVTAGVVVLTAPRYVAYATSPYTLRQVAESVGRDPAQVREAVVVTMAAATANITVTVTLDDPEDAARTANLLAAAIAKRAAADPILAAQLVSPAMPATGPAGPGWPALLAAGALIALAAGVAASAAFERYRRRRAAFTVRGVSPVRAAVDPPDERPGDSLADPTCELPVVRTAR